MIVVMASLSRGTIEGYFPHRGRCFVSDHEVLRVWDLVHQQAEETLGGKEREFKFYTTFRSFAFEKDIYFEK